MSNTKEEIELKELKDFNDNSPSEKVFSQVENSYIYNSLDNSEKKQRINQKNILFDWIISICNKFLIGVSLVFCMFMFEIKKDFMEENFIFSILCILGFFIIILYFRKCIFKLYKSIFYFIKKIYNIIII